MPCTYHQLTCASTCLATLLTRATWDRGRTTQTGVPLQKLGLADSIDKHYIYTCVQMRVAVSSVETLESQTPTTARSAQCWKRM